MVGVDTDGIEELLVAHDQLVLSVVVHWSAGLVERVIMLCF